MLPSAGPRLSHSGGWGRLQISPKMGRCFQDRFIAEHMFTGSFPPNPVRFSMFWLMAGDVNSSLKTEGLERNMHFACASPLDQPVVVSPKWRARPAGWQTDQYRRIALYQSRIVHKIHGNTKADGSGRKNNMGIFDSMFNLITTADLDGDGVLSDSEQSVFLASDKGA